MFVPNEQKMYHYSFNVMILIRNSPISDEVITNASTITSDDEDDESDDDDPDDDSTEGSADNQLTFWIDPLISGPIVTFPLIS